MLHRCGGTFLSPLTLAQISSSLLRFGSLSLVWHLGFEEPVQEEFTCVTALPF
jgi:hypothetical protein